jgi:two-component system chemotaxis response regulator CheB
MSKKYIVIGGSAGSFQTILQLLENMPKSIPFPIFLVLHRLKNVKSGFIEALSLKSKINIVEPDDKEIIQPGIIYLAPANYHMYLEFDNTISLSTEEPLNHSRPSIDITFLSAASSFKEKTIGVLLSGANKDGAAGLKVIKEMGGLTIVQDPKDAQIQTMPQAALDIFNVDRVLNSEAIINYISKLHLLYV